MKRKERPVLLRIVNAISAVVFVLSCIFILIWGVSLAAVSGTALAFCCIAVPVAFTGEGIVEISLAILEALFHAVVDAIVGIFEAISSAFSSIG